MGDERIVRNLRYLSEVIERKYVDRFTPQERQWLVDAECCVRSGGELGRDAVAFISAIRARCAGREI